MVQRICHHVAEPGVSEGQEGGICTHHRGVGVRRHPQAPEREVDANGALQERQEHPLATTKLDPWFVGCLPPHDRAGDPVERWGTQLRGSMDSPVPLLALDLVAGFVVFQHCTNSVAGVPHRPPSWPTNTTSSPPSFGDRPHHRLRAELIRELILILF
jgi:hypothetical protein